MLHEGRRRSEAGERVVVGWMERHGRAETRAQLGDLAVVAPRIVERRGGHFDELDVDAILRRAPDTALVDELAHTNADGNRHRWEDVVELIHAGCAVITTVNVANLISTREYAAMITGTGVVEAVPDEVVRSGDVILVDPDPQVLRQRIAGGRVFGAEAVGGALAHYFRPSNLSALSALGRAWMDGNVEAVGPALVAEHGVVDRPARPVVVAGVSGSMAGEQVIRRATAVARERDADLHVVHVQVSDGLRPRRRDALERYRHLAEELGAVSFAEVSAPDPTEGLVRAVRSADASFVVVARHRSRVHHLIRGSIASRLGRLLPDVAVIEVDPEV